MSFDRIESNNTELLQLFRDVSKLPTLEPRLRVICDGLYAELNQLESEEGLLGFRRTEVYINRVCDTAEIVSRYITLFVRQDELLDNNKYYRDIGWELLCGLDSLQSEIHELHETMNSNDDEKISAQCT
jgi:hypothetical protein